MDSFFDQDFNDISRFCTQQGAPAIHARTLYRAVYKSLLQDPWLAPTLPKKISQHCQNQFSFDDLQIVTQQCSKYDRTVKFLLKLQDGQRIETVLIPEKGRITLCVSSQVGCRQACGFCHTGRMGLVRHLAASEIVSQVVLANRWLSSHPDWLPKDFGDIKAVSNVVFMGMGEPFDNVEALKKAIRILIQPFGLGIAPKRISVSTAGHLAGLKAFRDEFPKIPIAISLHSVDEVVRKKLMPIHQQWGLADLKEAIRHINNESGLSVLIQYTLIAGLNDQVSHAKKLAQFLEGLTVKVNLIPFNEVAPSRFQGPSEDSLNAFRDALHASGVRVMVRFSKGQDIAAACGQLFETSVGTSAH